MAFWNKENAFGLPEGTIRAAIALMVVGTFCVMIGWAIYSKQLIFKGEINGRDIIFIVIIIIQAYFNKRKDPVPMPEEPKPGVSIIKE